MGCLSGLTKKTLILMTLGGLLASPAMGQQPAQGKTKAPRPTPAIAHEPSSAEIVNKLLSPGPSDPNVPLPRAGLSEEISERDAGKAAPLYGRAGEGGAVFGFKVPIPADRNAPTGSTRSGSGMSGFEGGQQGH
jgi:hypothetical protein